MGDEPPALTPVVLIDSSIGAMVHHCAFSNATASIKPSDVFGTYRRSMYEENDAKIM